MTGGINNGLKVNTGGATVTAGGLTVTAGTTSVQDLSVATTLGVTGKREGKGRPSEHWTMRSIPSS